MSDASTTAPTKDESNMAMLCYILAIFTAFIGPLIIWLIKKDQSAFVNSQGKEVLNWCITVALASIASAVAIVICIGPFLMAAVFLCNLIFCVMGAIKTSKGQAYRFPVAIRLLK